MHSKLVDLLDPIRVIGAKSRPEAARLVEVDAFALLHLVWTCVGFSGAVARYEGIEVDLGIGRCVGLRLKQAPVHLGGEGEDRSRDRQECSHDVVWTEDEVSREVVEGTR